MTEVVPSRRAPVASTRLTFRLLCLAVAFEAGGVGVMFPLLARIQAADHLPTYGLGLMAGAYFFAALLTQLGGGRFLDGERARHVLLGGLLLTAASLAWFALGTHLWDLVAARCLGGLGYGIVGPAALRAGTVGVPNEERGARLGRLSSAQMTGIVAGPLGGSVLASVGGLAFPFLVLAGALLGVFVALVLTPIPPLADGDDPGVAFTDVEHRSPRQSKLGVARRPLVALLLLAVGSQLANGLYESLWSRLLTDRGGGSLLIGLSLSLYGIPFILLAPAGGRLANRRGPLVVSGLALLGAAGLLASYGLVVSPILIVILGISEAVFQALAVPGGYAAVASLFPDDRAATGQGWFGAAGTASAGVAAVAGAAIYGADGPATVFVGGAVISAGFVVAAMLTGRGRMPGK
jgi:DHA1 family multidrug resistance protein-like MFS transporter